MRSGLKIAICLIAFSAIYARAATEFNAKSSWQGIVSHVVDGDTLSVRPLQGGAPYTVRLDGIDAPEICQVHGPSARAALVKQVLGKTVWVAVRRRDDYGRTLARVSLHERDMGRWMVLQGHAWSYRYRKDPGPYAREEGQARSARRGLFARNGAELPRRFRQRHGACH